MALCEQCYAEASRIKTRGWFHAWIADLALDGSQHSDGESRRPVGWQGWSHSWIASRARYESRWSLIGSIISSLREQYRFHNVMFSTCLVCYHLRSLCVQDPAYSATALHASTVGVGKERGRPMAAMGDNAFRHDDGEVMSRLVCQIARD